MSSSSYLTRQGRSTYPAVNFHLVSDQIWLLNPHGVETDISVGVYVAEGRRLRARDIAPSDSGTEVRLKVGWQQNGESRSGWLTRFWNHAADDAQAEQLRILGEWSTCLLHR